MTPFPLQETGRPYKLTFLLLSGYHIDSNSVYPSGISYFPTSTETLSSCFITLHSFAQSYICICILFQSTSMKSSVTICNYGIFQEILIVRRGGNESCLIMQSSLSSIRKPWTRTFASRSSAFLAMP